MVATTNPGPPVDPGQPWTDPDWEDPDVPGAARPPLPNDHDAPTVFEEGDNDRPDRRPDQRQRTTDNAAKVAGDVSEAGL